VEIKIWWVSILITGYWDDSATYYEVPNLSGALNLVNGVISDFDSKKFYAGGDRPEHVYSVAKNPSSPNHKVSFIHNFDIAGNILSQQVTVNGPTPLPYSLGSNPTIKLYPPLIYILGFPFDPPPDSPVSTYSST
jgi:hypothetical protein